MFFGQLGEGDFVEVGHFEAVALVDHVAEVGQKLSHGIGDEAVADAILALELSVQSRVASGPVIVVVIVLEKNGEKELN